MLARMHQPSEGDRASAFERAIGQQTGRPAMAAPDDFPAARAAPFHRETKSPVFAILR